MTPGCTTEACDFRDSLNAFAAAGITVVGLSPDPPEKLAQFRAKEGLNFPLASDPDRSVLSAYGAFGEKKLYGKTVMGVIRSHLPHRLRGKDRARDVQRPGDRARRETPPRAIAPADSP